MEKYDVLTPCGTDQNLCVGARLIRLGQLSFNFNTRPLFPLGTHVLVNVGAIVIIVGLPWGAEVLY